MPEGDTIYRAARTLNLALAGQVVTAFETVLPNLARVDVDSTIAGRAMEKVEARGKWLLMYLSGDLILLTHMLMNGSWHIYRLGETWRCRRGDMRIVLTTEKILAVAFRVPIAEFHTSRSLLRSRGFNRLGLSILDTQFDEMEMVTRVRSCVDYEIGDALLKQSVLSGIGNVYKSELCFACGVNPFRLVRSMSLDEVKCVVSEARKFMLANFAETTRDRIVDYKGMRRTTRGAGPHTRLWVYQRKGEPCRRCRSSIEARKQGLDARITFWCPQCQMM